MNAAQWLKFRKYPPLSMQGQEAIGRTNTTNQTKGDTGTQY